nr:hypothetical protein BaRGS_034404 [Batillaria attramentaria]
MTWAGIVPERIVLVGHVEDTTLSEGYCPTVEQQEGASEDPLGKVDTDSILLCVSTLFASIFNIRWPEKIRNEELWERAGQEPVAKQILRRKWGWIGHTLRKPASSTTRQALTWNPQGKRKRGRPRNSWRRDTEAELFVPR